MYSWEGVPVVDKVLPFPLQACSAVSLVPNGLLSSSRIVMWGANICFNLDLTDQALFAMSMNKMLREEWQGYLTVNYEDS